MTLSAAGTVASGSLGFAESFGASDPPDKAVSAGEEPDGLVTGVDGPSGAVFPDSRGRGSDSIEGRDENRKRRTTIDIWKE